MPNSIGEFTCNTLNREEVRSYPQGFHVVSVPRKQLPLFVWVEIGNVNVHGLLLSANFIK